MKKGSFFKGCLISLGILCISFVCVAVLISVMTKKDQFGKSKIGVVRVDGVILSCRKIISKLEKFRKNPTVRGIVLRVDSVGGGVAPSQEIYEEIKRIRKTGKKVVASMGSVAASGGYYIACGSDRIFANPGTLTGSIGVIMEFPNVQKLMDVIGIKSSVIKSGKFKDIGSPVREMTKEEEKLMQEIIDDVYDQFVTAISEGRGIKKEDILSFADGRIFSGHKAKELGLVDELGGMIKAIQSVAELCKLKDYEVLDEEKTGLRALFDSLNGFFFSPGTRLGFSNSYFAGLEYRWNP